jgi:limonene 1,2-monooxygenase
MAESVEVIKRLLAGDCVSAKTDWFEINEGRLQLMAFRHPIEIVVASAATPFSMKLAGTLKLNAMSHVAPPWGAIRAGQDIGVGRLPQQWNFLSEINTEADRADWRLVVPLHVSDSESQAKSELFGGWQFQRQDLYQKTLGVPIPTMEIAQAKAFEYTIGQGGIIVGSPDDCLSVDCEIGGFGRRFRISFNFLSGLGRYGGSAAQSGTIRTARGAASAKCAKKYRCISGMGCRKKS